MLLSVHMTSVLYLVWFNNFALTTGFYWSYISHPFLCSLELLYNLLPRQHHCKREIWATVLDVA